MRYGVFGIVAAIAVFAARQVSAVSLAFDDPEGGWTYAYLGEGVAPGTTVGLDFTALDGTWDRQNGSDEWDGSGLGGTFGAANRPGGISALTDAGTSYIRIQDTGDPSEHGHPDPSSNRKILPGHNIDTDPGVVNPATIAEAVTLTMRARIATAATGVIDPQFPDSSAGNGENAGTAPGTAWPTGGSGILGHDGGKGSFSIRQSMGDQIISFSLSLSTDARSDSMPFGTTGLTMNSLNGTAPSGTVDPWQNEGTINVLPIGDVTVFHEFWITIAADQSMGGTHKVDVYSDGSFIPTTFHVTAGTGNDYGTSYLAMGSGATQQQAGIDVDFFAYKEGIHLPGQLVLGDTDGDGVVELEDFDPIRDNFRKNVNTRSLGDLTLNGVVDFVDFREWKTAFLGGGGSLAGLDLSLVSNVPEPSSVLMLLSAIIGFGPMPYRRRPHRGIGL